jgi:UDP-N-acetylmuramoylalanine--D-glutamate ligase
MMTQVRKKRTTFKGKNILVVGIARSGVGAANLLSELGAVVTVTDSKPRNLLKEHINRLSPSINIITDENPDEVFKTSDMIVVSPGVPHNIPPLQYARKNGIQIMSELEIAYQVIQSVAMSESTLTESQGKGAVPDFIGITGTNGKSTTTTLVDLMLKESGCNTIMGGNIGNALTEEILNTVFPNRELPEFIVAEISSFQLEAIHELRPKVAAILNITPDHLDRYESMLDYINAKARIFENQTGEDFLILNADDPLIIKMMNEQSVKRNNALPEILYFSRRKEVKGVYCKDGILYCNIPDLPFPSSDYPFISAEEIKIKGLHNLENAMAASLAALVSGHSYQSVGDVLKRFSGLEHRLEPVCEIKGVSFINDSKATNTGSVEKSLEGLENVVLIMGGLDKGSDFSVLRDLIRKKVKALILIGEAKNKISKALAGETYTCLADDLDDAVRLSMSKSSSGDVVLLSPGCASFDMFTNFEERGNKFKESVKKIQDK